MGPLKYIAESAKSLERDFIILIVCNHESFPDAERWVLETLFKGRKIEFYELSTGLKGLKKLLIEGKVVFHETLRYDEPLERYRELLEEVGKLDRSGVLVCIGDYPRVPASLKNHTHTIWYYWPDLMSVVRRIEDKLGELSAEDRGIVEREIFPLVSRFDYSAFREAVESAQNLKDLIRILSRGGNLPETAVEIVEAWIPRMKIDQAENFIPQKVLQIIEPAQLDLQKQFSLALKLSYGHLLGIAEASSYWLNLCRTGLLGTIDLRGVEEKDAVKISAALSFWHRVGLRNYQHDIKMVVLIRGVRSYALAKKIKEIILTQLFLYVSVIFFELNEEVVDWGTEIPIVDLGDGNDQNFKEAEKVERVQNEVRHEPDPVRGMHEKNKKGEKQMKRFNIDKLFDDMLPGFSSAGGKISTLISGIFALITGLGLSAGSLGANVIGFIALFLGPAIANDVLRGQPLPKTADAITSANLWVVGSLAFFFGLSIGAIEMVARKRMGKNPFWKRSYVIAAITGISLTMLALLTVNPPALSLLWVFSFIVGVFVAIIVEVYAEVLLVAGAEMIWAALSDKESELDSELEKPAVSISTGVEIPETEGKSNSSQGAGGCHWAYSQGRGYCPDLAARGQDFCPEHLRIKSVHDRVRASQN